MRVTRVHPALLGDEDIDVAVVIDVLRATSTAVALMARGTERVQVVATPEELAGLPPPPEGSRYLVFSELDSSREFGLECVDNSPHLAESVPLEGRRPVLVTTNGTRAIGAAMSRARAVLLASFGNLSRLVAHLLATDARVTLVPAGDFAGRDTRTEDERCADAIEAMLDGRTPDLPALVADVWQDARVQRRIARHPELRADIDVALAVDRHHPALPRVIASAVGHGFDVVAGP